MESHHPEIDRSVFDSEFAPPPSMGVSNMELPQGASRIESLRGRAQDILAELESLRIFIEAAIEGDLVPVEDLPIADELLEEIEGGGGGLLKKATAVSRLLNGGNVTDPKGYKEAEEDHRQVGERVSELRGRIDEIRFILRDELGLTPSVVGARAHGRPLH